VALRTVLYVEVQDFPAEQVRAAILQVTKNHANAHPFFCIPLRYGKLLTDYEFEGEFLETVNKVCEVGEDGEIQLKDGAEEVEVIRQRFG
jgi:hypothetical protein